MQNNNTTQYSQNKKVGVVIPIYNVAPYLRECLDSVINQAYKNLSIVLVNDGSTDNNESLNIAKEYVAKDSRFILIDKENGGLSSARNVGIAWFSEKYETKLDISSENSLLTTKNDCRYNLDSSNNKQSDNNIEKELATALQSYNIANENPYNVYKIYANDKLNNISFTADDEQVKEINKSLHPEQIDYIIFLDSDDYWRSDCIESCIKHSDGVDIVWFDFLPFYEEDRNKTWEKTLQEYFNFKESMHLSGREWLDYFVSKGFNNFYFAWSGLIDFKFLKDIELYFLNGVIHEDHNFGSLLFLQSESIYVLKDKLYLYRIRPNSITTASANTPVPHYAKHIYDAFTNKEKAKQYHKRSSMFLMLQEFVEFLDKKPNPLDVTIRKRFLPYYAWYCESLITFTKDPLNIIPKMGILLEFLPDNYNYVNKIRIKNPKLYKRFKPFFMVYDFVKKVGSKIIRILKKNFIKKTYRVVREIVIWSVFVWVITKIAS